MKMFDEEVLELHELFDGLVENNLSIKQKARLQFLLENSEDARVQYVLFMDLSSSLRHYAEELVVMIWRLGMSPRSLDQR